MRNRAIVLSLLTPLLCAVAHAADNPKLELKEGDRILLIGNTFFERDLYHNHFETLVTLLHPDKQLHFRNLGWSGDTVWVNARIGSSPASNPQTLARTVLELKPNVIFLAYGMNESFEGEAGLARFIEGYNTLLDALAPTNAKLILISPNYHEDKGRPLPDPSAHNASLKLYTQAIGALAEKRGAIFIDLFTPLESSAKTKSEPLTENGIHLNSNGYKHAASIMARQLGMEPPPGLAGERYEKLRAVIKEKNILFFDQYRPQNDMYLFHGRKHEQGRNAREMPMFTPFIEQKEAEIAKLKKPQPVKYTLERDER